MSVGEMTPLRREGTKFVCDLPDDGPWELRKMNGSLIALSQTSGVYEVVDGRLVKLVLGE